MKIAHELKLLPRSRKKELPRIRRVGKLVNIEDLAVSGTKVRRTLPLRTSN